MMADVIWQGVERLEQGLVSYGKHLESAPERYFAQLAPRMAEEARELAPWQDRTGQARAKLYATVQREAGTTTLRLAHGVPYGLVLETRFAGRYAVILPTLHRFYAEVGRWLRP